MTSRAFASISRTPHVAVVGAGAFGGWTALSLLRNGAKVTLLDAWGPGNARASSGGETRIIRGTYGPAGQYTRMAARALELWKENERGWNQKLFHRTGVLWMASREDTFEKVSLPLLRDAGINYEELSDAEARRRFPQISFENVKWCIWEQDSGFLMARRGCQIVLDHFLADGGEYREVLVTPGPVLGREMSGLALSGGTTLQADQYVFACGPWLGKLFPDIVGNLVRATRQEVFFFGTPPGDARYSEGEMPTWIDRGPDYLHYGVPGNEWRGFKAGDDARGSECDPTSQERTVSPEGLRKVRNHVEFRFPGLKGAPVVETRVCQYEQTPDENFIIDRHPAAANAWLVGGGSGHGYKHGPAVGELVAQMVLGGKAIDPIFGLARFAR